MNIKKAIALTGLVAATVGISPLALAQGAGMQGAGMQDAGFYAGGSAGLSKFKDGCTGFVGSCDDKDTAWKIFGGYDFNRNFGVEVGYVHFGEVTATDTILGVPVSVKVKAKGFELLGVGKFPINEQFAVYGKAGLVRSEVDASATGGGGAVAIGEKGTDFTYGLGLKYNFTKNLAARVEWQRYRDVGNDNTIGKSDVDVFSVGLVVKF